MNTQNELHTAFQEYKNGTFLKNCGDGSILADSGGTDDVVFPG